MKLAYTGFSTPFMDQSDIATIQVEQPFMLQRLLHDLYRQMEGEGESYVLSKQAKILPLQKHTLLVPTLFNISLNERTTLNKVYRYLVKHILSEYAHDFMPVLAELDSLLNEHLVSEGSLVTSEELPDLASVLKLFGVRFDENTNSILETLEEYILIHAEYFDVRLFVLNFVYSVLTDQEMRELFGFVRREGLNLLIFEGTLSDDVNVQEGRHLIIDRDLCDIIVRER